MRISGARVRELRELRMLSQQELAEAAGTSEFTVQRVERGGGVRPSTGRRLAEALSVEPGELLEDPKGEATLGAGSEEEIISIKDVEYERALDQVLKSGAAERDISEVLAEFEAEVRWRAEKRRGGAA